MPDDSTPDTTATSTGATAAPDDPTVSVVLPTRNRAGVLGRAVESVLDQSCGDLELIVVDGASTDRTPDVVDSFDDGRLRYRRKEAPEGVSAARNDGVEAARGDLVAFVDADDRWRTGKLARQVDALQRSSPSTAVVLCGMTKAYGEPLTRGGASGDVHEAVRRLDLPTYTSTLLVRADALVRCGGFDERLGCFEDWELCLRLSREYDFRYLDEPLVVKGTAGDNVSADPDRIREAYATVEREHDLPEEARAQFLADVGKTYCEAGRLEEGRPFLVRSLRTHPRRDAALSLLFSLPGSPATFDALKRRADAVERTVARVRG